MNRRNAIVQMTLSCAGLLTAFGGYKWLESHKQPDTNYLTGNKALIAALAETIIPRTELPGATDANVADYILINMSDCCSEKRQNRFINGLKDVQQYTRMQFGRNYEQCNEAQQETIMRFFEEQADHPGGVLKKIRNRMLGKPFFTILKEVTVAGYCTSMPGATEALAYLDVPGRYEACTTITPGQRAWAIN
ncbi:gluconate 2-dehydrogenase subunit 3 family protein [Chitinophaga horti]|uniref:Gluconate 2-dehydrogenase subunit 3 family protein n=1 Tax=Chitinophaga horti TaxID=2920382 RepID=A0ABY6IUE2_9BACT|nr:gluconate 2-dehydrogenase subunit 3 family protein [Chitinophaga horti]UYQ90993.1 gluconate 2-dehydrogenase subunit 3 family protein [Chitinophaga horti]